MWNRRRRGLIAAALAMITLLPATQASGQESTKSPPAIAATTSTETTVTTTFSVADLSAADKAAAREIAHGQLDDPVAEAARRAQLSGNVSFYDAAAHAGSIGTRRERLGLPTEPDADFTGRCASRSDGPAGYIENRFHWCTNTFATGWVSEGVRRVGLFYMDLSFVGYGRDDGDRSMAIFVRPTRVIVVGDGVTPLDTVGFGLNCAGATPGCDTSARQTKTLAQWTADQIAGSWTRFDLRSDENQAEAGYDKASYHWFSPYLVFKGRTDPLGVELGGIPATFGVRCDSARYLLRGGSRDKACIFSDVIPHLQYAILNEDGTRTNQASVAEHIRQAQDHPDSTWPLKEGSKDIPGQYVGTADGRFLSRIPRDDDPDGEWSKLPYETNVATKDLECLRLRSVDPPPADMPRPQCDEYPFASTWEGAGYSSRRAADDPPWDFSVKYVPGGENGSAGTALKNYYRDDRILFHPRDQFWVEILDKAGQAPSAPPRQPSAGPEVFGNEGSPIQLHGATNQSAEAGVNWTIRPGDGVDSGAVCTISSRSVVDPTVTCDDDGTFIATMTVTGAAGTLSASTLVHVYNVPPRVTITSPHRWDKFQVGAAIPVTVAIDDPGTHDTHDCLYIWDDNGRTSAVTANDSAHRCVGVAGYSDAGMYTIAVTVFDDDSASAGARVMIVVFDPIAGKANIDGSARGTLFADPNVPGDTYVHLDAAYNGGGTFPPTGVFETWIQNHPYRIKPESVQWLVITPDHKVAARGTGTINGQSGYSWLIYGRDDPSSVRIVTWRTGTDPEPQNLLYDTFPGTTEFDMDRISYRPTISGAVQIHYW